MWVRVLCPFNSTDEGLGIMQEQAMRNFEALSVANRYFGRGLVLGLTPSARHLVQVYWLSGRSSNSRNRVFVADGGKVWTEAADPSNVEDPSLIIYTAMDERASEGFYVVSNGAQTDAVVQFGREYPLRDVMENWEFEPDTPNYTPRITAVTSMLQGQGFQEFSILRRNPDGSCDRSVETYSNNTIPRGFGHCVTTYTGEDTNPLPSFVGDSYVVPILDTMGGVMEMFRGALENPHFISLAVKFIDRANGKSEVQILNRYEKVA